MQYSCGETQRLNLSKTSPSQSAPYDHKRIWPKEFTYEKLRHMKVTGERIGDGYLEALETPHVFRNGRSVAS